MARTLAQLKREVEANGLTVIQTGREAKGPYETALRNFYWHRDFPGAVMPPQYHPMLARNIKDLDDTQKERIWNSPEWVAQEKVDGCRLLMSIGVYGNTFSSRRISDVTYRYSENTDQLPHLKDLAMPSLEGTVLDGEVQCYRPDIDTGAVVTKNVLQATVALLAIDPEQSERIQREQNAWLVFRVFDILRFQGNDVTKKSLRERLKILAATIKKIHELWPATDFESSAVRIEFVPLVQENKKEFYNQVVKAGGEGIMLKDLNAPYEASSSRTRAMYKVKRYEEYDLFVTGFVPGDPDKGWDKLIGGLECSAFDETTGQPHITAVPINLTLEQRISATACRHCGHKVLAIHENVNGKRIVQSVGCSNKECQQYMKEFGPSDIQLYGEWLNKVFVVRGQEFTARVLRLKHAVIMSERFDKAPEDCKVDVQAISAKFESKGAETGIVL